MNLSFQKHDNVEFNIILAIPFMFPKVPNTYKNLIFNNIEKALLYK